MLLHEIPAIAHSNDTVPELIKGACIKFTDILNYSNSSF